MGLFSRVKEWDDGDTLTEPDLEAEFDNIYDNIVAATTSVVGMVQLEDSVTSTSVTKAATPKSVKEAYDHAGAGSVSDTAYGAGWNGVTDTAPSKNAVYDKIETLGGGGAPDAHKDSHDPADGSDPLDTAAPSELANVQAAGVGSSHSLARADHQHQIQHSIANNHIVTIDHAAVADNDYAKFTVNGLEGRSKTETLSDLNVEDGATKYPDTGEQAFLDADHTKLNGIETSADVTDTTNVATAGAVMDTDFAAADEIMVGTGAGTHGQITLAASQILGKKAAGAVTNLTNTEARIILNVEDGATADNISDANVTDLTDGFDTTLHDHDGISENTSARHTQGSDTALGAQAENLDMNTHKIVGVVDPTANQDVATKKYGDDNWAGGGGTVTTFGTPVDNDFAKFTDVNTIEGRSYSEAIGDLSGQAAASFDMNSQALTKLSNVVTTHTPGAAGTATLDLDVSRIHDITMPAGNITIAISNENNGDIFTIRILQDGTGSRTVTWFSTIKWAGGSAPTLTTTASKADTVIFRVTGTDTYDGFVVGKNI